MPLLTWLFLAILAAVILAILLQSCADSRRTFEPELRRELARYRVTLVSVRKPRLSERSLFPIFSFDPGGLVSESRWQSSHTRIVTVRTADGRGHEVWARIDFDDARPAVGLDYMQIDFSPKISELKRAAKAAPKPQP